MSRNDSLCARCEHSVEHSGMGTEALECSLKQSMFRAIMMKECDWYKVPVIEEMEVVKNDKSKPPGYRGKLRSPNNRCNKHKRA